MASSPGGCFPSGWRPDWRLGYFRRFHASLCGNRTRRREERWSNPAAESAGVLSERRPFHQVPVLLGFAFFGWRNILGVKVEVVVMGRSGTPPPGMRGGCEDEPEVFVRWLPQLVNWAGPVGCVFFFLFRSFSALNEVLRTRTVKHPRDTLVRTKEPISIGTVR